MRVIRYSAHNVLKLTDIEFNLEGRHLFLVGGKNDQGKSSALTALLMALCGKSGMDSYPEVALKQGEDKGWVKVMLSGDEAMHEPVGIVVELFLRRKLSGQVVEELRVLDSTGEMAGSPRKLLQDLCAMKSFDPLAFERMDPKARAALLARLVGLDFTTQKTERQEVFSQRTVANREVKSAEGAYSKATRYPTAPKSEVAITDLLSELEAAERTNTGVDDKARELNVANDKAKLCSEARSAKKTRVTEAKLALDAACEALTRATYEEEQSMVKVRELAESLREAEKTRVYLEPIKQRIKDADGINRQVRANQEADRLAEQYKAAMAISDTMTRSIQEIDQAMADAMEKAKWPIPGLGIVDDCVVFEGLPFEQACTSSRYKVSMAIGMALNPRLRLLVCQGGGDLDMDSFAEIGKIAEENDFQILVELVTRTSADEELCAVIVEDGGMAAGKSTGEPEGDPEVQPVAQNAGEASNGDSNGNAEQGVGPKSG